MSVPQRSFETYGGTAMSITIEAIYENGVLKPVQPLTLREQEKVQVTVHTGPSIARRTSALIPWTGSVTDLDYLINDTDNDPLEVP
jgi:predicted DNA-binding antitoxin AbrB/MazE fold protein